MDTLEYDHNVFDSRAAESDKSLAVSFFVQPVRDEEASAKEGRPIYKDTVMVEIRVRGDRKNIVHKPVDENIKRRFPAAWRAYEQNLEMLGDGTPLSEWTQMSRSMVEEMKHFGFYTVEHVAEARDDVVMNFPGLRTLKDRAKAWLEMARGERPLAELQTQLEQERSAREAMEAQVKDLASRLEAATAKSAK